MGSGVIHLKKRTISSWTNSKRQERVRSSTDRMSECSDTDVTMATRRLDAAITLDFVFGVKDKLLAPFLFLTPPQTPASCTA